MDKSLKVGKKEVGGRKGHNHTICYRSQVRFPDIRCPFLVCLPIYDYPVALNFSYDLLIRTLFCGLTIKLYPTDACSLILMQVVFISIQQDCFLLC